MNLQHDVAAKLSGSSSLRSLLVPVLVIGLIVAMALDTTVVRNGSDLEVVDDSFSPEAFGAARFPVIQEWIEENAVPLQELVRALEEDRAAAIEQYGTLPGAFPIFPVTFSGEIEEGESGIVEVIVDQVPEKMTIRLQTGPAINGTELRDVTGTIKFQQFRNQIEYQDAGQALNNAMRAEVLDPLDRSRLPGSQITVTGAFTLINPNSWLVTPVRLSVL